MWIVPAGRIGKAALVLAVLAGLPATAPGQEVDRVVQLHGFGTAVFGKTNHNEYSVGDPEGSYDHGELALVVLAHPADRLSVSTNVSLEQEPGGVEAELDYAFAEWRFSDAVRLRAGRVKQPFGLYAEIFDVGTLRPFVTLPQGIYGPAGFVAEGFDGLSVTGRLRSGERWAVSYDVYGGSIQFGGSLTPVGETDDGLEAEPERIRNVVGGRLAVETPVNGLAVGVSSYTGEEGEGRHSAAALHLEYLDDAWSVRTAIAHLSQDEPASATAFYVEAARRIGRWQVAARYEGSDTDEEALTPSDDTLFRHRDASIGLNYWFAPDFAIKVSYHRVDGNLHARPEGDAPRERRTDLIVVGAQFSF